MPWPEPPLPKGYTSWDKVPARIRRMHRIEAVQRYMKSGPQMGLGDINAVLTETIALLEAMNLELYNT